MGEIADLILGGAFCQECGAHIDDGEEPGHPRSCAGCLVTIRKERKARRKSRGRR